MVRALNAVQREAGTPFHDRALYMHGWSQFKQGRLDESLRSFFGVLDLKIAGRGDAALDQLEGLSRADRELVEDSFRALSIQFADLEAGETLAQALSRHGGAPGALPGAVQGGPEEVQGPRAFLRRGRETSGRLRGGCEDPLSRRRIPGRFQEDLERFVPPDPAAIPQRG